MEKQQQMKAEELKKEISKLIANNSEYSPQARTFVIHGAVEAIYELIKSQKKEWQREAWNGCKEMHFIHGTWIENVKADFQDIGLFAKWYNQNNNK